MSILGNIMSAIFGSKSAASAPPASPSPSSSTPSTPRGSTPTGGPSASAPTGTGSGAGAAAAKPLTRDELEEIIEEIADKTGQQYNWDTSIVDLMKLLKLDSSLNARKELAKELGYKGELNGSAEMNIWLHKQVMEKLMASGGAVPDSLKSHHA